MRYWFSWYLYVCVCHTFPLFLLRKKNTFGTNERASEWVNERIYPKCSNYECLFSFVLFLTSYWKFYGIPIYLRLFHFYIRIIRFTTNKELAYKCFDLFFCMYVCVNSHCVWEVTETYFFFPFFSFGVGVKSSCLNEMHSKLITVSFYHQCYSSRWGLWIVSILICSTWIHYMIALSFCCISLRVDWLQHCLITSF